ncbi:MAG: sulfotransferase [Balneolaceae bacterium]|nr:sulfotransferase [Balneolaceae bacterium]
MAKTHHPIRNLTAQLKEHQAFSKKNFRRIAAFYLKLFLQEPFRIFERLRYGSKIKHHTLNRDPIFIIGHWRSGTSFLQYLMAQDPQFGFMNKFQVVFPDIFLHSEKFLKPLINKIPDTLNLVQDAQNMSINLELDSPSEIEIALTTMISPTSLHWGHIFPKNAQEYFDKYLFFETASNQEIEQWKKDYAFLIKKISLSAGGLQVLIKSPGNASRIEKLLELYPKAKFIFIHRNPYDVFYSSKKLWNTLLDNLALQEFSDRKIEQEIVKVYKKLMSAYIQQRTIIPEEQLAEIRFENFVESPLPELEAVYNKLDISGFKQAEPYFEKFIQQKTSGKSSNYNYENYVINTLNKHWEFAFEEWNYPIIEAAKEKI